MGDSDSDIELQMEKLRLKKKAKELEAQLKAVGQKSENNDKEIIRKFNGGVATKGILSCMKKFAKQELIQLPDDIKLYSNSLPTQASHKVYQSFKESSNFISSFFSSNYSQDRSIGGNFSIGALSLGANHESSSSSGRKNENAQENSSSSNQMSVVIYEYIPKGSFDLPPSEIILTKSAERRALRIKSLEDAFEFFEEFGAFVPVCTYTLGGIYMSEVRASGKGSLNKTQFSSSASSAMSSKIGGSIGFGGFSLSGSKGSSSSNESGGSNANSSASGEIDIEIKCLNYGPQHVNIEDFRKAINQNRNEWTSIGCNLTKLKPIYEIIKDTDKSELEDAIFYLNVAHIVKNLENSMVNQLMKKFEKADTNFDIDMFLSSMSKDIQKISIEEFSRLSLEKSSNSEEVFKKFEKWLKQIYNNAINQNLDVIQKILDLSLDFPDSLIQINNIYLESKSQFAFVLYYNDELRRLNPLVWNDLLDCMKDLKKENQNEGHYILCNIDLHHELDEDIQMGLYLYFEGKQKKLMLINQDFLDFHKISLGQTEINMSNKKFTYYIEDNLLSKLKNLKKFVFKNSKLSEIRKDSFSGLSSLEVIDLENNQVRSIEENSFSSNVNLDTLSLAENKITEIGAETFEKSDLKVLNLSKNLIEKIDRFAFHDLGNLRSLNLNGNKITSLEKAMFDQLDSLESLFLNDNQISRIEDNCFSSLKSLKILALSKNKLNSLGESMLKGLKNLRKLDLSSNEIKSIDKKAFVDLIDKLNSINLSKNKVDYSNLDVYKFEGLVDQDYDSSKDY